MKFITTLFLRGVINDATTRLRNECDRLHRDYATLARQLERLRGDNREEIAKRAQVEKQNEILRLKRNVAFARPAGRLDEKALGSIFRIDHSTPLWCALHQELDDHLQDLMDQVSLEPSAQMTEQRRLHLAGGIEALRRLQKALLDRQTLAHHHDEEMKATP